MLKYEGVIRCTPELSDEEVIFLNQWQNKLNEIYFEQQKGSLNASERLDDFIQLPLEKNQRWTICTWAYSPMIHWSNRGMEIFGEHTKGQFREAVLAYLHLLIGENPVIRNACYKNLSFLKEHTLNGVIQSQKEEHGHKNSWLYVVENNEIFSVEHCSITEYLNNPTGYHKQSKEDTCMDKLNRYFPPLYRYAQVAKTVYSMEKEDKSTPRNKI